MSSQAINIDSNCSMRLASKLDWSDISGDKHQNCFSEKEDISKSLVRTPMHRVPILSPLSDYSLNASKQPPPGDVKFVS